MKRSHASYGQDYGNRQGVAKLLLFYWETDIDIAREVVDMNLFWEK